MSKKGRKLSNDKATKERARRRRAALYQFWLKGANPVEVSRMRFTDKANGEPFDFTEDGFVALSTIKSDWKWFEKEAAKDPTVEMKRGRAAAMLYRVIADADDVYKTAEDKEKVGALNVKVKAIAQLSRIYGLEITKHEHTGKDGGDIRVETRDPRLSRFSDEELGSFIEYVVSVAGGSAGKGSSGGTPTA